MTSTAWLYLRLSKDKDTSEASLADQESKLRDRARAEGMTVGAVYNEGAGRSAYKAGVDRPEWERLIADISNGVVVMAVETSRFSRNTEDGLGQIRRIRSKGGHVLTLDGNDSRADASALPMTVRLAVAEEESRLKSERLRRARERDRQRGIWHGRTPYGHRRRFDGKLELDPETAPTLRRIVDLAISGTGSAVIARTLSMENIPNPNGELPGEVVNDGQANERTSLGWRQVTVGALLRNPILCGWMPRHRHGVVTDADGNGVVVVHGPTICTVAERGRLRAIIGERSQFGDDGRRQSAGRPTEAVLRGLIRCGRCGATMLPMGGAYRCDSRRNGGTCVGLTATRQLVDDEAVNRVIRWLAALDPDTADGLATLEAVAVEWIGAGDGGAVATRAVAAAGELTGARQRLAALDEAHYLNDAFSDDPERYVVLHKALSDRVEVLRMEAEATAPRPDIGPLLDTVQTGEALSVAAPEVVRSLVTACVTGAEILAPPSRGSRWDPERLVLTFR